MTRTSCTRVASVNKNMGAEKNNSIAGNMGKTAFRLAFTVLGEQLPAESRRSRTDDNRLPPHDKGFW